ncbi:type III secretion system export apparatus subunit SctT [Variovorax sp. KK3]|uniref:type III secretion system export apparatus subunit SctT n=1 Tax=Variovorax sp. KK3 TaxID=1855728 RepID=UPI0009F898D0|nr:type III secretion system export apparatus subunit SctT [Variovorax sp. KK3]
MDTIVERPLDMLLAIACLLPRLLAMFASIPVLSRQALPGMLRIAVVFGLGLMIMPTVVDHQGVRAFSAPQLILLAGKEAALGFILGFMMAIPIWAFDAMGSIVDNQRGASIAQTLNPMTGHDSSPLGELFSQAAVTYLVISGGLLLLLDTAYRSYEFWPVFEFWPRLNADAPRILLGQLDRLLNLAVLLGAPVIVAMLIAEIGLALISRFAPQLQVFFLAMPIKSGIGMFVFAVYAVTLIEQGGKEINDFPAVVKSFRAMLQQEPAR